MNSAALRWLLGLILAIIGAAASYIGDETNLTQGVPDWLVYLTVILPPIIFWLRDQIKDIFWVKWGIIVEEVKERVD